MEIEAAWEQKTEFLGDRVHFLRIVQQIGIERRHQETGFIKRHQGVLRKKAVIRDLLDRRTVKRQDKSDREKTGHKENRHRDVERNGKTPI